MQTIGRGLRPGKEHLIVLDHAGNHQRLGLVTDIHFDALDDGSSNHNFDKGKADREPSIKLCPQCVLPPRARECPACGLKVYAATEVTERDGLVSGAPTFPSQTQIITNRQRTSWKRCGSSIKAAKTAIGANARKAGNGKVKVKFKAWPMPP